ncbi:MAG: ParB/RepB/Spo0J family partition protein [Candidatus Krumholzibacteriia bacterium]
MVTRTNRVLGKGLSALIQGADELGLSGGETVRRIPVAEIGFNPAQPRQTFDEEKLDELAASIRQVGVLQPVLVRRLEDGEQARRHPGADDAEGPVAYCVVAGERRVRAARRADLAEVPALVCTYRETEALKVALLENIQREDLGPLEEAQALQDLMQAYGATQEELAQMLGKSRSAVANSLRLLLLEDEIKALMRDGKLSRGHAKVLLGLPAGAERQRLARICASRGLSVRDVERRVQQAQAEPAPQPGAGRPRRRGRRSRSSVEETPAIRELRRRTERALGSPVTIETGAPKGGNISIKFFDDNDLERILGLLGVDTDLE